MKHFRETLYDALSQEMRIDKVYFESGTGQQHLMIFHNAVLGRVMTLDGIVQTTEADEFIYHEMLTHVPILAHGKARSVLIVGGGDGGMLREVCRHGDVERIVQVEIDEKVIEMSKQWLPNHSAGAFDDPRFHLVIADGLDYVRTAEERFDVIISDSTDPIGPGEALFTQDFYSACKRCLNPGGVVVTQNGVAFFQLDEVRTTHERMTPVFADHTFYSAAVPTYYGGIMTFAWGSDDPSLRQVDHDTLATRMAAAGLDTRYYTPDVHLGSFALPRYVEQSLRGNDT
ncbi:MAG: polyamine aminopropyltransferase [Pseudomonadota bacterium]